MGEHSEAVVCMTLRADLEVWRALISLAFRRLVVSTIHHRPADTNYGTARHEIGFPRCIPRRGYAPHGFERIGFARGRAPFSRERIVGIPGQANRPCPLGRVHSLGPYSAIVYVHGGGRATLFCGESPRARAAVPFDARSCAVALGCAGAIGSLSHLRVEQTDRMGVYKCACPNWARLSSPVRIGILQTDNAMVGCNRHLARVLAGVRSLPDAGVRLRLDRCGSSINLATLFRFRRALGKECQSRS